MRKSCRFCASRMQLARLRGTSGSAAVVVAMLLAALTGALLLKTSLFLPLVAGAGLALATWLVYVPAAVRFRG